MQLFVIFKIGPDITWFAYHRGVESLRNARPYARQPHRAELAPGKVIYPTRIFRPRVHGPAMWIVYRRFMESFLMLNWGAPLPSSLASSRRPGRPPDPRYLPRSLPYVRADVWRWLRGAQCLGEMASRLAFHVGRRLRSALDAQSATDQ